MDKIQILNSEGRDHLKSLARRALRAILSGKSNRLDLDGLVGTCHALAVPYIRRRLSGDIILKRSLAMSVSDFAYDSIADLFAYADTQQFPHFEAYFAAYPINRLSDEEILSHLRRLVFSHCNQRIFRLYNDVDPSLGKILRNIKLALQQFPSLSLFERFGEPCLVPSESDPLLSERIIDVEELEVGLRRYLHGTENIPFMLGKLALYLHERSDASRVVSLTSVGVAFRSIYTSTADDTSGNEISTAIDVEHLSGVIRESVMKTKRDVFEKYVTRKKVHPSLLDAYFNVIEKRLNLSIAGDGDEKSLRELLAEELGELNDEEYKSKHRSKLEYLSRLAGEEVARQVKTE